MGVKWLDERINNRLPSPNAQTQVRFLPRPLMKILTTIKNFKGKEQLSEEEVSLLKNALELMKQDEKVKELKSKITNLIR